MIPSGVKTHSKEAEPIETILQIPLKLKVKHSSEPTEGGSFLQWARQ